MNNRKIKAITDGAICTALSVLLLSLTLYLPAFAMIAVMVAGLPMVFLAVRDGLKVTGLAALASVLVMGILAGDFLSALLLGVVNLLPGVMIGYGISRRRGFVKTVFFAAAAVLAGVLLQVWLINMTSGGQGIAALIDDVIEGSKQMMKVIGMTEQAMAQKMNQMLAMVKELLLLYLPSMLIGLSAVLGYGAVAFAIFMLRRIQKLKVAYIPFSQICAPRAICYLSLLLSMVALMMQETTVYAAALKNLVFLTDCFIGVCGFSLIDDKLSRKLSSGYARAGIYVAALTIGYLVIGVIAEILVFLGMLDGLFGIRRFRKVGERHDEEK